MQPDQMVAELLARGDMNDNTTVELNRILDDFRANKLDPDDESYLRALHAKLMDLVPEPETVALSAPSRIDGLTIEDWRDRALLAEARVAELEETAPTA